MKEVVSRKKSTQIEIKLLKHLRKMSQSGLIWGGKKKKKKPHLSLQEGRWFYVLQKPFFSLRRVRHFVSEGAGEGSQDSITERPSQAQQQALFPPPQSDTCWGGRAAEIRSCFAEDWLRDILWAAPRARASSGPRAPAQHTNWHNWGRKEGGCIAWHSGGLT